MNLPDHSDCVDGDLDDMTPFEIEQLKKKRNLYEEAVVEMYQRILEYWKENWK